LLSKEPKKLADIETSERKTRKPLHHEKTAKNKPAKIAWFTGIAMV